MNKVGYIQRKHIMSKLTLKTPPSPFHYVLVTVPDSFFFSRFIFDYVTC